LTITGEKLLSDNLAVKYFSKNFGEIEDFGLNPNEVYNDDASYFSGQHCSTCAIRYVRNKAEEDWRLH
jgi:hypothetical protein